MSIDNKRYRLLKDIVSPEKTAKAGEIGCTNSVGDIVFNDGTKNKYAYGGRYVEMHPEWFELIPETQPSKPLQERISVQKIKYTGRNYMKHDLGKPFLETHEFITSEIIPEDKFPAIKAAIEKALNCEDTVECNPCTATGLFTQEQQDYVNSVRDCDLRAHLLHQVRLRDNMEADRNSFEKQLSNKSKSDTVVEGKGSQCACMVQVGMKIRHTEDGNWDKIGRVATVTDIDWLKDNVLTSDKQNHSIKGFLDKIYSGRYEVIYYPTPPTNKTVTDNSDVACLSVNDIKECCHDDSAGGGVLYLFTDKLHEKVTQKLKQ